MTNWWQHYANELPSSISEISKEELEYSTGRLPLLLRALLKFRGQAYEEIKVELVSDDILCSVKASTTQFTEKKLEEIHSNPQTCKAYVGVIITLTSQWT